MRLAPLIHRRSPICCRPSGCNEDRRSSAPDGRTRPRRLRSRARPSRPAGLLARGPWLSLLGGIRSCEFRRWGGTRLDQLGHVLSGRGGCSVATRCSGSVGLGVGVVVVQCAQPPCWMAQYNFFPLVSAVTNDLDGRRHGLPTAAGRRKGSTPWVGPLRCPQGQTKAPAIERR